MSSAISTRIILRAWRSRETFQGRSGVRTWLYRIATNCCSDALRRGAQRARARSFADAALPQSHPGDPPEEVPARDTDLDALIVAEETVEIAYLAAIQLLPPRQRAVLFLRDVLGWRAVETASLLGMTVAAANSALQRSRATLRERLPQHRLEWSVAHRNDERCAVLRRQAGAHPRSAAALAELIWEDIRAAVPA